MAESAEVKWDAPNYTTLGVPIQPGQIKAYEIYAMTRALMVDGDWSDWSEPGNTIRCAPGWRKAGAECVRDACAGCHS